MYITPAPERIFILKIKIVPWGRDLLNLKEVVCGTLSHLFAMHLKKRMIQKTNLL